MKTHTVQIFVLELRVKNMGGTDRKWDKRFLCKLKTAYIVCMYVKKVFLKIRLTQMENVKETFKSGHKQIRTTLNNEKSHTC